MTKKFIPLAKKVIDLEIQALQKLKKKIARSKRYRATFPRKRARTSGILGDLGREHGGHTENEGKKV